LNESDIVHFLQLHVPGGAWIENLKADGGFFGLRLISEAVSPGFDFAYIGMRNR
jgi:predicted cupin superfamily sugar epimerase